MRLIGGPGQENDMARAEELVDGLPAQHIIADRGYDAGHLIEKIEQQGGKAVIPSRTCWSIKRTIDA